MRTVTNNSFKRMIAGVLTLAMLLSLVPILNMGVTVDAASGGGTSGGGTMSSGGSYGNEYVMVYPSSLKETSTADDLKNYTKRYANTSYAKYPVIFRVSGTESPDYMYVTPNAKKSKWYKANVSDSYIDDIKSKSGNLKFFYNEIHDVVTSKDFSWSGDGGVENMGDPLNKVFGAGSKYKKNTNNCMNNFIKGYGEAAKKIYGDKIGTQLYNAMNSSKSFLIERGFSLNGENEIYTPSFLSRVGYDEDVESWRTQEADIFLGDKKYDNSNDGTAKVLTNYTNPVRNEVISLFPKVTVVKNGKSTITGVKLTNENNEGLNTSFGGWAFFEMTHTGDKENWFEDSDYVKSTITYNAYLGSRNDSETDKFGENGLVSTDLVNSSSIVNYKDMGRNIKFTVDDSIKLDTPYVGADFDLTKLSYRITNPQGSEILNEGSSKTSGTVITAPTGGSINSAISTAKDTSTNNYATTYVRGETQVAASEAVTALEAQASKSKAYKYKSASSTNYDTVFKAGTYATYKDSKGNVAKDTYGRVKQYIYSGGTWYYCPIIAKTQVLIQVRADYLKTYTKDEVGKTPTVEPYMLAKNLDIQSDFTKKQLTNMIDSYPTSVWGALKKRANNTTTNTGERLNLKDTVFTRVTIKGSKFTKAKTFLYTWISNDLAKSTAQGFGPITPVTLWASSTGSGTGVKKGHLLTLQSVDSNGDTVCYIPTYLNAYNGTAYNDKVKLGNTTAKDGRISPAMETVLKRSFTGNAPIIGTGSNQVLSAVTLHAQGNGKTWGTTLKSGSWLPTDRSPEDATSATGYKASEFCKIVAQYNQTVRLIRGKQTTTAPKAASWRYTGSTAILDPLGLKTSSKGNLKTAKDTTQTVTTKSDYGFVRLGKTGYYVYNTSGNPIGFRYMYTRNYSSSSPAGQMSYDSMTSSIDVPIRVNWKQYFIGKRIVDQPIPESSSSGTTIKYSSDTGVDLSIDPEVPMWYETSTSTSKNRRYGTVTTVGDYMRQIPVVAYNKLSVDSTDTKPTITAQATAADARSKTLVSRLGGNSSTPVIYSGSPVTITYDKLPGGLVTTYVPDIKNTSLKSEWGNGSYVASNAVNKFLGTLKVDSETYLTVNGKNLTLNSATDKSPKIGSSQLKETWDLTIKGGAIEKVTVNGTSYTISQINSASSAKTKEIKEALTEMRLIGKNNILTQAFAHGNGSKIDKNSDFGKWLASNGGTRYLDNGWYFEDTNVLCIRKYETDFTTDNQMVSDKLPLNLGPATPADRNKFFSNGYKGTVNLKLTYKATVQSARKDSSGKLVYTDKVLKIDKSTNRTGVDFIVPDVTITDAVG